MGQVFARDFVLSLSVSLPSKLYTILHNNTLEIKTKERSLETFKQTSALSDRKYFHLGFCLLRRTVLENKE